MPSLAGSLELLLGYLLPQLSALLHSNYKNCSNVNSLYYIFFNWSVIFYQIRIIQGKCIGDFKINLFIAVRAR